MRNMAMSRLRLVIILQPFHQLTMLADPQRRHFAKRPLGFSGLIRIELQKLLGFDIEAQQSADYLDIHRRRQAEI